MCQKVLKMDAIKIIYRVPSIKALKKDLSVFCKNLNCFLNVLMFCISLIVLEIVLYILVAM